MKLVAKAKPVKIRIKSGGEEHSSLDSLKMNFCIDDVRELLDGRLSRWLRQQNEILLAEEIDKFESKDLNSDDKCLEFIKLLFYKELESVKIESLFDLAKHWCLNDVKYKLNGESIFNRIINTDVEAAKYAYKNNILSINWIAIFLQHQKDPEALYIEGKLWFDGHCNCKDIEHGYKLIKEAAAYGWEEAVKFELEQTFQKAKYRFWRVNREKIIDKFIRKWPNQLTLADYSYACNDEEKQIFQFLIRCKQLFFDFDRSFTNVWLNAREEFKDREGHLLEYEMRTIITIIEGSSTSIIRELEPIKEDYPPANYIFYKKNSLLNGVQFRNLNQRNKIKFIVQHLFDFD